MKRRLLNVHSSFFKFWKKYRNLYLRLGKMLRSGEFALLSERVQKNYLRKLDIYYRRVMGYRMVKAARVAMLAAGFTFMSNALMAQSDSIWVEHPVKNFPLKEFKFWSYESLATDVDGDGLWDIIARKSEWGSEYQLWKQTNDPKNRFVLDSDWNPSGVNNSINSDSWGDYDGDGDMDRLYADGSNQLFENIGDFVMVERTGADNPFASVSGYTLVMALDYDNDGDLDLLTDWNSPKWKLTENITTDGGYVWGSEQTTPIADLPASGSFEYFYYDNIDSDEAKELILEQYISNSESKLHIYENDFENSGKFVVDTVITINRRTNGFMLVDWDNDGDMDLFNSYDYYSGNPILITDNETGFEVQDQDFLSPGLFYGTNSIDFMDIDADGDMDMVGASYNYAAYEMGVKVWENTGSNKEPIITASALWEGNKLDSISDSKWFYDGAILNLDNDAELEALVSVWDNTNNVYSLKYYEKEEDGSISEHDVNNNLFTISARPIPNINMFQVIDYNNDGDNDICIGLKTGDFVFIENQGTKENPNWVDVSGIDNPLNAFDSDKATGNFFFTDVNNDGKFDLLVSNYNPVFYEENTSEGTNFSSLNKSSWLNLTQNYKNYYGNIDNNGRLDVIDKGNKKHWELCPAIQANNRTLTVDENQAIGTVLAKLPVEYYGNDSLYIEIISGNDANLFTLKNNTDTLLINGAIDFETVETVSLGIKATSLVETSPGVWEQEGTRTSTGIITININNLNDNVPAFAAIATDLNVDENAAEGTELVILSATDADGELNTLNFSTEDAKVAVDATTGKVTVKDVAAFDFETAETISFDVKVSDGTNEDTETVTVAVNNVNDNAPAFAAVATDLNVDENAVEGTELVTLAATDADGNLNALSFSTEDTKVAVDATTGKVTVKDVAAFDFETAETISFDVKVSDGTNEDTETVTIAVNNLNDNAPAFAAIATNLNVDENAAQGTELVTLSATDADGNLNALSFSTEDTKVAVDATTGKVTVKDVASFDFETAETISFDVKVSDGTNEDTETVTVTVNNLNDNAPAFAAVATDLNVDENAAEGTELVTLSATDADGNLNALSFSTEDTKVAVDATTGKVMVKDVAAFDFETAETISFDVKVSDGTNEDTETVTVAVNNLNDNLPVIEEISIDLELNENAQVSTTIVELAVSDLDKDLLSYTSSNPAIAVNAKGKVEVAKTEAFDFEEAESIDFTIEVSDGKHKVSENYSVALINLNDNNPVFATVADNLEIDENATEGTELVTLSATDADGDLNALSFSTEDAKVAVDATTGKVTVKDALAFDFESAETVSFDVKVSDGTNEDTETVTVTVNNVNDNDPVFVAIATDLNVDENAAEGTELVALAATDADGELNALSFSTEDTKVAVDATTGKVTVKDVAAFDFETAETVSFDVKVSDGTNEDTETVTVAVNNLNDNAPAFDQESYQVVTADTVANGTKLLTLSASDADNLEALAYSMVEASDIFELSTEGELSVKDITLVDSDNDTAVYTLTAKVSDTELDDEATIVVKVDITTGMFTVYRAMEMEMYPNPANEMVNLIVPALEGEGTVNVYSIGGQLVLSETINNTTHQINVSSLEKGVYVVKVQNGQKVQSKRLVVE